MSALNSTRPVLEGREPMSDTHPLLVVDDDPGVQRLLETGLTWEGYEVRTASGGSEALASIQESPPDLVLLDILMPEMDGFEVCRRIREISSVPIIFLTALNADTDLIQGLDAGADEFVSKPISLATLVARIRAVMRRSQLETAPTEERRLVCDGGRLVIDFDRRVACRGEESIPLSDTEFRLLSFLIANRDRVVSHRRILEHVWGSDYADKTAYLRTYIGLLRRKIEEDRDQPRHLVSSHGVGYCFQTG